MAGGKQNKLSREEELLLQDFSRNVSTKSSALFYGNAFIVSAIPVYLSSDRNMFVFLFPDPKKPHIRGLRLFWRIHQMDLYQSAIIFAIGTIISTYLVAMAYRNLKFILKHKIAVKREDAVAKETLKKFADDKRMTKKEKDERVLWKKNEIADYEATTFSIFYNNALYLALLIVSSFFVLKNFNPVVNYSLAVGSAAGLLALFSTSSKI